MTLIDADAYLEALKPPQIKIGGKIYTGRPVGFNDALRLLEGWEKLAKEQADGEANYRDFAVFIMMLCNELNLPAKKILKLPPALVQEAVQDFLQFLAQTVTLKTKKNRMNTTESSPSSAGSAESLNPNVNSHQQS